MTPRWHRALLLSAVFFVSCGDDAPTAPVVTDGPTPTAGATSPTTPDPTAGGSTVSTAQNPFEGTVP